MFVQGHNCTLTIDTSPDVQFGTSLLPITGASIPEFTISPGQVYNLTADDFTVGGDATCQSGLDLNTVTNIVAGAFMSFLNGSICVSCTCISV